MTATAGLKARLHGAAAAGLKALLYGADLKARLYLLPPGRLQHRA